MQSFTKRYFLKDLVEGGEMLEELTSSLKRIINKLSSFRRSKCVPFHRKG